MLRQSESNKSSHGKHAAAPDTGVFRVQGFTASGLWDLRFRKHSPRPPANCDLCIALHFLDLRRLGRLSKLQDVSRSLVKHQKLCFRDMSLSCAKLLCLFLLHSQLSHTRNHVPHMKSDPSSPKHFHESRNVALALGQLVHPSQSWNGNKVLTVACAADISIATSCYHILRGLSESKALCRLENTCNSSFALLHKIPRVGCARAQSYALEKYEGCVNGP